MHFDPCRTIKHWDVINENLHGSWYEEATHNDQFLQSMFNQMHDLDPSLQLFMNDYDVMSLSLFTSVSPLTSSSPLAILLIVEASHPGLQKLWDEAAHEWSPHLSNGNAEPSVGLSWPWPPRGTSVRESWLHWGLSLSLRCFRMSSLDDCRRDWMSWLKLGCLCGSQNWTCDRRTSTWEPKGTKTPCASTSATQLWKASSSGVSMTRASATRTPVWWTGRTSRWVEAPDPAWS